MFENPWALLERHERFLSVMLDLADINPSHVKLRVFERRAGKHWPVAVVALCGSALVNCKTV